MTYDEAQAEIKRLLAPYAGKMDRETAIRGLLESGPLAPTCPDCGRQDCHMVAKNAMTCRPKPHPRTGRCNGTYALDREDYMTEECSNAEDRELCESEFADKWADDCMDTEERLTWQGELTAILGRMYREAADRADQAEGLARALTKYTDGVVALVDHNMPALVQAIRERDEAWAEASDLTRANAELVHERDDAVNQAADLQAELDALKVRARGLWRSLHWVSCIGMPPREELREMLGDEIQ